MKKNKISGLLELGGLTVVVIASAMWITRMDFVPYLFAFGAVFFAIGRMMVQQEMRSDSIAVKRLLRQRTFAVFALLFSSVLMFVHPGYYFGYNVYLQASSWLVPFIVFVVIEVYTAFRLPIALKKG